MTLWDVIANKVLEKLEASLPGLIQKAVEQYFKDHPIPVPQPTPVPVPEPEPIEYVVADMDTIASRMREAGFHHYKDHALWYALGCAYSGTPWAYDIELIELEKQNYKIHDWFDGEVVKVLSQLKSNPKATAICIVNDGPEKCGFRLGPAIRERLCEFGDRVKMGELFQN
ncbi:MAG: hypothetical protein AB1585_03115 [Thermodesulfobacteriota bacterium]